MTNSLKLLAVVSALAVGSAAVAQQTPAAQQPASNSAGLLGQRYASAGFSYLDISGFQYHLFAAGARVNLPIRQNIDVGVSYARNWIESNSDFNLDIVDAYTTFIYSADTFKTYTTLSLGHVWEPEKEESVIWGARAGAEFPVTANLAVRVSAGYDDDFESGNNGAWDGTASVNYWVTKRVAALGSATWLEGGAVSYGVGVAFRF